uniref:Pentatricopeptide repeat-containing protein n=1 Tax=Rhizophora mucronata TaxID=61149 RepID=A0A2P2NP25_RHIMU
MPCNQNIKSSTIRSNTFNPHFFIKHICLTNFSCFYISIHQSIIGKHIWRKTQFLDSIKNLPCFHHVSHITICIYNCAKCHYARLTSTLNHQLHQTKSIWYLPPHTKCIN